MLSKTRYLLDRSLTPRMIGSLASQVAVSGSNLLLNLMMLKLLGLQVFGAFSLMVLISFFVVGLMTNFIIQSMVFRLVTLRGTARDTYITATFCFSIACMAGAGIGLWLITVLAEYLFLPDYLSLIGWPFFMFLCSRIMIEYGQRLMFALDRSWSGLAINLSASLGQLAAAGLLISWDVSEVDDVFATIAGVQGFVITLALMTLRFRWRSLHYLLLLVRQHWTFSRWLMASTIASWLAGNSYLFVAGALIGTDAVGVFRAVQNILSVFNLFLLALRNVAPVQFAKKMKAEGIAVVMAFGVRVSLILFGLFVLAGAPLIIFPSAVLDLVYGNADVSAYGWLLQLMLLLPLLSAVDYGLREAVYVSQRGQYLFGAYVLVAIINITTANFVVAQWGLQGVALGMVVSQFVIVGALIVALLTSLRLGR